MIADSLAIRREAIVEGEFKLVEISEDMARHLAEEIAKIAGPQKRLRIAPPPVLLEGVQPTKKSG